LIHVDLLETPMRRARLPVRVAAISLLRALLTPLALAQAPGGLEPASDFNEIAAALRDLRPEPARAADVSGLVIEREAGRFTLEAGTLYLLSPVGGRTVGAVFVGRGTFAFSAPSRIEQDQLERFLDQRDLVEPFRALVLLFADTTVQQLESQVTFSPGSDLADARSALRDALLYLTDEESQAIAPDLLRPLLNGETNAYFYAHVLRRGDPLMFTVNPYEAEGVRLLRRAATRRARVAEVIAQFPPVAGHDRPLPARDRTAEVTVSHYAIETWLARSALGNLSFAARARIHLTADERVGPWVPLLLYPELTVDSVRSDEEPPTAVVKAKKDPTMWLRLPKVLGPADTLPVEIFYQGDLIDRLASFFFIKTSAVWYPRPFESRSLATFDITYHSPKSYLLVSVGDRTEEATDGESVTSRWVVRAPIRNASFNIGQFEEHDAGADSGPPLTLLASEAGHRAVGQLLGRLGAAKVDMRSVAQDLSLSLQFFSRKFGPLPERRFYATEIPYQHGEAFPGLVHLAWTTFEPVSDRKGYEAQFRAHEVAHQWWGIGVDFATYHDQWLSEGFAEFSGLWYLHAARRDNDLYVGMLRRWRDGLLDARGTRGQGADVGPISLGYRTSSSRVPGAYDLMVYHKGAWVLHMLRILLLDLQTVNEDTFTQVLRDYYSAFAGGRASTADFLRVVEQRVGEPMDWFFDQWVNGTGIPTYRVAWRSDEVEGGKWRVQLRVRQADVPDDFRMPVPVTVDLGNNRFARLRVNVQGPVTEIDLPLMPGQPRDVRFNELDGVLCEVKLEKWDR
jgi:hypothetical protein